MSKLKRSTSQQDLSSLDPGSACQSIESFQSLPLLNDDSEQTPPNYYQMCINDLIELSSSCKNESTTKSHSVSDETFKQIVSEIDRLRDDNIRLVATVLKNNENIQLLTEQYRLVLTKLDELRSVVHKIEKQQFDLEEKSQLNLDEIKLLCSDVEDLHSVNKFLQSEIIKAKNDNLQITENYEKELKNTISSQITSSSYGPFPTKKISTNQSIDSNSFKINDLIANRIDSLENKLTSMSLHNTNIYDRLDQCLKRLDEEHLRRFPVVENNEHINSLLKMQNGYNLIKYPLMSAYINNEKPIYNLQKAAHHEVDMSNPMYNGAGEVPAPVPETKAKSSSCGQCSSMGYSQGNVNIINQSAIIPTPEQQSESENPRRRRRHHRLRLFTHRRRCD